MKKSLRSTPWSLVSGAAVLMGLAVGVALVGAREPAKMPAQLQSVEAISEIEAAQEALGGPHAGQFHWCQYPVPKVKPAAAAGGVALVGLGEVEPNSTPGTAQLIPYGDGGGQDRNIDVTGNISPNTDLDYFRITATKGDVLGLAVLAGGAPDAMVAVTDLAGTAYTENDDHQGQASYYPLGSPLPGGVNSLDSVTSWIVPANGDYLIRVSSYQGTSSGDYTLQLRGPRPYFEQLAPRPRKSFSWTLTAPRSTLWRFSVRGTTPRRSRRFHPT